MVDPAQLKVSNTSTPETVDDLPPLQPRDYQLEMFERSMKENVIVAVCHFYAPSSELHIILTCDSRWTLAVEKLSCESRLGPRTFFCARMNWNLIRLPRALLRVQAELDRCPADQVPHSLAIPLPPILAFLTCSPCSLYGFLLLPCHYVASTTDSFLFKCLQSKRDCS